MEPDYGQEALLTFREDLLEAGQRLSVSVHQSSVSTTILCSLQRCARQTLRNASDTTVHLLSVLGSHVALDWPRPQVARSWTGPVLESAMENSSARPQALSCSKADNDTAAKCCEVSLCQVICLHYLGKSKASYSSYLQQPPS